MLALGGNDIAALGAALKATNNVLTFIDYTTGPIIPGPVFSVSAPAPDSLRLGFFDAGGGAINQDGLLVTLRFQIDPNAAVGATADLNPSELSASDPNFVDLTILGVSGRVTVPSENQTPTLSAILDQTMNEGESLDVPVSATDPDGDTLTLSANNLPSFGSVTDNGDGTGLIRFTPAFGDAGTYLNIEVIASDGELSNTITFTLTVGIDFQLDFSAILSVADNCVNSQDLMFGTSADATDGFDPAYDQFAPPLPPAGAFDARHSIGGEDFLVDFRATNTGITVWDVHYQAATDCDPIILSWDAVQFPEDGYFSLVDPSTGGDLVNVDMRTVNNYADNLALGHLQIVFSLTKTFDMQVAEGWNMVSLAYEVADPFYLFLFPNAIPGTTFGFDGSYFSTEIMSTGIGYWLRFPAAETVPIEGTTIDSSVIDLGEGWNMIGGPSCDVSLGDVIDQSGVIMPGTLFGFDGAYFSAATIKQGRGYWIRANAAGTITLPCRLPLAKAETDRSSILLDPSMQSAIEISDASGATQTLYFDVALEEETLLEGFSLPPVPPSGSFDARFAGDYRLIQADEAFIHVQSSHYPLSIRLLNLAQGEGLQYAITEIVGNQEVSEHIASEDKQIVITDPRVKLLKLSKIVAVPKVFAVFQNYPNPFNPTTKIIYSIPQDEQVSITVYNALGQVVKTLVSKNQKAGHYSVVWGATNNSGQKVGSGVYLYVVKAGNYSAVKKMILLK